jgi:hypothetical protein
MMIGALLLIGIWALLVGILAALHICDDPIPPRAVTTPSVPDALDTHKAVMTLWLCTQFHLDELERAGADVTAARQNLTQTAETLLFSHLRHQAPPLNEPGSQALAAHDAPRVVDDRFGPLRIFG